MKNRLLVALTIFFSVIAVFVFIINNRKYEQSKIGGYCVCYYSSNYAISAKLMDCHGVDWYPVGHSLRASSVMGEYVPEDVLIVDVCGEKCAIVIGANSGIASTYARNVHLSQLSYDQSELDRARDMKSNCHIVVYYQPDIIQSEYYSHDYNENVSETSFDTAVVYDLLKLLIVFALLAISTIILKLLKKPVVIPCIIMIVISVLVIVVQVVEFITLR